MYHIAHGTALCEYLITLWFRPAWKTHSYATEIGTLLFSPLYEVLTETRAGIVFVIIGQALRSMAMIHAATNFSHAIAWKKLETHKLVTDGIYACVVLVISFGTSCSLSSNRWFRHPSYTGFFYWASARSWSCRTLSVSYSSLWFCGASSVLGYEVRLYV